MKPIFIHIPKNAGMTIRHHQSTSIKYIQPVLESMVNNDSLIDFRSTMRTWGFTHPTHSNTQHTRWLDLKPEFKNRIAFAVIRNPWDRVVSRYFFAKKVIEVEKKHDKSLADVSSFEAFLEERHKYGNIPYLWNRAVHGWFPATTHVCDEEGILKCDMLRFCHLNNDVCAYLGLKQMSRARNVTALNKGTYMDMYNDKTIQIVADWYASDIEMWGFDFDTGATRNYWHDKVFNIR